MAATPSFFPDVLRVVIGILSCFASLETRPQSGSRRTNKCSGGPQRWWSVGCYTGEWGVVFETRNTMKQDSSGEHLLGSEYRPNDCEVVSLGACASRGRWALGQSRWALVPFQCWSFFFLFFFFSSFFIILLELSECE